jgi:multidrug efflux system outer membrane protein
MKGRFAVLIGLSLAGCAIGPDYERPSLDVPAKFRWQTDGATSQSFGDADWWKVYGDDHLVSLIRTALAQNYDVRIAAERIAEAEANLGTARLQFLPNINGTSEDVRERLSPYQTSSHLPFTGNSFTAALGSSWEIDLWGRIRRLNEGARADLLSRQFAKDAVVVALVAEVATAEFQLTSLDEQLRLTRRTVKIRQDFVDLTRARHDRGVVSGLDVSSAEAQLAVAEAQIPDIERQIGLIEDQLSLLLGQNPGSQGRPDGLPDLPPVPIADLPSSLLSRRPDLREAEQNLVSANAQVGATEATLFPTISLTGALGTVSPSLARLTSAKDSTWSGGLSAVMPILDPQRSLYQVDLADATKREAILAYQKAVQGAFKDVADALIGRDKNAAFVAAEAAQVTAFRKAEDIALARYRQGYASYFDVINADSQLFTAELTLASARLNAVLSTVQLYQALGGGWDTRTDPAAP